MAASGTAIDAEFVLKAQYIRVAEVEKIRRTSIRIQVFFEDFESDSGRVVVAFDVIIHGTGDAFGTGNCMADGFA